MTEWMRVGRGRKVNGEREEGEEEEEEKNWIDNDALTMSRALIVAATDNDAQRMESNDGWIAISWRNESSFFPPLFQ